MTSPYETMSDNSGINGSYENMMPNAVHLDVQREKSAYKVNGYSNPSLTPNATSDEENMSSQDGIYGNIPFLGITRQTKAKFMWLPEGRPPQKTWEMMEDRWGVGPPSLVISVIGGAKDFHLDERIEASLKAAIRKASRLPDAYITTGGSYTGIMKIISDAAEDCAGVCLGISAWNDLVNREISIKDDEGYPYVVGSWLAQNGLYLDYKHSHFILVNEKEKGMGETLFRACLERYLIDYFSVPAILLVVNGGSGTLDFLHEVVSYSSFPVVVVEKSGRVADLLAYALKSWNEITKQNYAGERHEDLYNYMKQVMLDTTATNIDINESTAMWLDCCYTKLMKCLEKRNLFSLATMGTDNDIDAAIINGLLAGKKKDTFERLKLTLLWDRPDYARSCIFSSKEKIDVKDLHYIMVMALSHGNHEYVKLLMDYGVNMYELLTKEILEYLYGYQAYEDNFLFRKYIDLDKDYYNGQYINNVDALHRQALCSTVVQRILNTKTTKQFKDNEILIFNLAKDGSNKLVDPFWELFIWAVMCNLQEMAKFLWPFGRDQMSKALIAADIWHVLGTYDGKRQKQTTISLINGSNMFKAMAHELLDECCTSNEKQAIKLYTTTQRHIPEMSCLDIAVAIDHFEFVAHNSIQVLLTDVWTGYLKTQKVTVTGYIRILLAIVFPFFILPEIKFFPGRVEAELDQGGEPKNKGERLQVRMMKHHQKKHMKKTTVGEFFQKLGAFYFHTPVVTFVLHFFGCAFFLALYSYVVIMAKITVKKNMEEIIILLWVVGYLVGEVYQIIQYRAATFKSQIEFWLDSSLNRIDVFNILTYFTAWGMSFHSITLPVARTLHALNCGFWILRLSTVVRVNAQLSLYLEMIRKMSTDLFWFLFILLTVVLAYGVTSTALLFPGVQEPIVCLQMLFRSWFNIFGEHFINYPPENKNETHLISPKYNSYDEYIAWCLMGVYLLISNILLLNIIIAAFNTTYANVEALATHIAKFRKHDLVVEYSQRASTPPPLSLVHHLCLCLRWLIQYACRMKVPNRSTKLYRSYETVPPCEMEHLQEFEYHSAVRVYKRHTDVEGGEDNAASASSTPSLLQRVELTEDRLTLMVEKMEERINTTMKRMESKISDLTDRIGELSVQKD